MTYGVQESVQILIGGYTPQMTAANTLAAIVMADTYVDSINSSASDAIKTQASNEIAANILLQSSVNDALEGITAEGSTQGTPSRSGMLKSFVPEHVHRLLISGDNSQIQVLYYE